MRGRPWRSCTTSRLCTTTSWTTRDPARQTHGARALNLNTALLVGDVLLGLAYRTLLKTRTRQMETVANLFTAGVLEVCEGQALDMEFEKRLDVTVDEYFRMIEKKTGRLISLATEIGALIGGARSRHRFALRRFGHHLGRAFQLQDDLLDVVAEEHEFGKMIGGDIAVGKRPICC